MVSLQEELVKKAQKASGMVLPGYTHLQHAQPVLLSHHLLAYFWKVQRDFDRMNDCFKRTNLSPLGSGALAGTGFKIDRTITSKMLGMDGITENSLDSVSDRDFAAEASFALSLLMVHLSSFSEELVLWSSSEFGFIKLPKQLSSGSSMMPQKRNPDIPELVRGKSGRAIGDLVTILTLLKSLPLAYNRDLQEDKEPLFDVIDTAQSSLDALTSFLRAVSFDGVMMRRSAEAGLMTATDLADLLTTRGMPFRTAHGLVKEIAELSEGSGRRFEQLADKVMREQLKNFKISDLRLLSIEKAIERRSTEGGTSPAAVAKQMEKAKAKMSGNRKIASAMKDKVSAVDDLLR
jgi:argininosuccinate lyase